jgi:ABC-type sulfate/molybdate transport systems ATPase subunit
MLALATRVIVMQRGMIAADGTPQAVLAPPKMVNPAATAAATAQTAPAVVQVPKEVSHGHHILRQHA